MRTPHLLASLVLLFASSALAQTLERQPDMGNRGGASGTLPGNYGGGAGAGLPKTEPFSNGGGGGAPRDEGGGGGWASKGGPPPTKRTKWLPVAPPCGFVQPGSAGGGAWGITDLIEVFEFMSEAERLATLPKSRDTLARIADRIESRADYRPMVVVLPKFEIDRAASIRNMIMLEMRVLNLVA